MGAVKGKPQKNRKPTVRKLRKDSLSLEAAKPLTDQQDRFVAEYLVDFDRIRALKAAGYKVTSLKNGASQASYLLNLPNIALRVMEAKKGLAAKLGVDAEGTLAYLKLVFFEAYQAREWSDAISALREIGRVYGIYEADNRQKKPSYEDLEQLRAQLEMKGFDFTRKNFPAHLLPQVAPTIVENVPNVGSTHPVPSDAADVNLADYIRPEPDISPNGDDADV